MTEEEIEDLVGDVRYTDSQKSVTTSIVYSFDFTDCSPDRINSTGQETYVIECDDSDFSEKTFEMQEIVSPLRLNEKTEMSVSVQEKYCLQNSPTQTLKQSFCTSYPKISIVAKETFTQTSKTIIEVVQGDSQKHAECKTLETQTSFVSINENRSLEYRIHVIGGNAGVGELNFHNNNNIRNHSTDNESHPILANSLEDKSSVYRESETDNDLPSRNSSNDTMIRFIDDESKENFVEGKSVYESSTCDTDVEEDSLMENEYNENKTNREDASDTSDVEFVDNDVQELYNKLSEKSILFLPIITLEPENRQFGKLSPLTEETSQKKENVIDDTPSERTLTHTNKYDNYDPILINSCSNEVKVLKNSNKKIIEDNKILKLPPITKNQSSLNSPHLNFLISVNTSHKSMAIENPRPYLSETQDSKFVDRWEISRRELASGESPLISGRSDHLKQSNEHTQLPPIPLEGDFQNINSRKDMPIQFERLKNNHDSISIKGKIRELKMIADKSKQVIDSRSVSPTSTSSPTENLLCNAAEKGCDALCVELLRRLRSLTWLQITETLENLSKTLEKFWSVITENRIATLLRQVTAHVESPRTRVAKAACGALADILKNTNYTKKPDFYEAISALLIKTGSLNGALRRAANVALDEVVCGVDTTQSLTAICVHGVGHRAAAVRRSSARLLVVCGALAGGGRRVLRDRPRSVAAARRHALRALALLLRDTDADTRKYAERLYRMLRPWPNFEAYFLTDVDAELATHHMKKYDQLLCKRLTR